MVSRGILHHERDFLDSFAVIEECMRHFYVRAIAAKRTKQPDEVIGAAMIQAAQIAEKIAPFRHARLSAAKLAGTPTIHCGYGRCDRRRATLGDHAPIAGSRHS